MFPSRTLSFVLSLLLINFSPIPARAQQSSSAAPQPGALLSSAIAALVGNQSVRDVTLSGTARRIAGSDDESGTVTLRAISGGPSRIDLNLSSGAHSEVRLPSSTSGPVGTWSGPDGVAHAISYHNLLTDSCLFPAFTFAAFVSSPTAVVTFVGQETRNGATVLHLSAYQQAPASSGSGTSLLQHLSQTEIYLDPATFRPTAIAFNTHPDDNALLDIPVSIEFSDYRSVNSSLIPFHLQKFFNNTLALDLQFASAATNTGLSASDLSAQ
jgi:hypothetical protein